MADTDPLAQLAEQTRTLLLALNDCWQRGDVGSLPAFYHPDVILLDIEMPRMDGYELAGNIRNDSRLEAIPIIMITSRVGAKHRARAIELGVDDYLGKPYQEAQLLDAIEPLVQEGRAGNE